MLGVITLAILENLLARREANALAKTPGDRAAAKKAQFGALALLFPLLYCLFDTIGTAADGIILDEETGLGLGEIDVLILYGLTFLAAGIVCWVFLWIKNKKPYNPIEKAELLNKGMAACFEEFGQVFYVFAMARKPVLAAPMVASYCIVSVLLSRIILKENIGWKRYLCVGCVILGIVMLGIAEGLGEIAE